MVPGRIKNILWEWLSRIIKSHRLTYKIARNILRIPPIYRIYRSLNVGSEFQRRINQRDPSEYLDISYRPNLNVIILVIDALRNSRLSCRGYFRETTPFLDSFKTRFSAITAAPWTYPSVASILTGLYPHNHNVVLDGKTKDWTEYGSYLKLRGDILTLPEILSSLGYGIYFGTAIPPAYWAVMGRGVPKIYDVSTVAEVLLNDLTRWISEKSGKRFFAYVHLADLHPPLNIPDSFRSFFGDVKPLPKINRWDFMTPEQQRAGNESFEEYRQNRELLYDNTLRYVDCAIERLYNSLKDMGLLDSTVFIVTADHGEQFWEHAELDATSFYHQRGQFGFSHGDNVCNEVIEVPLLVSGPVSARKGTGFVSTVDIVPTVVDLLGISHKMRFDGQNIFETQGERPLLSEAVSCGYEKKALVVGRYKLIYSKDDGIEWLFDLDNDPQEQHPIVDKEVTSIFMEKLLRLLQEDEKRKIREISRKKSL